MVDKQEILRQLQCNRNNPTVVEDVQPVTLGMPIQIAEKDGSFLSHMMVVRGEDKFAILQYSGELSLKLDMSESHKTDNKKIDLVSKIVADIVEDAIDTWFDYKHYHLPAYSFIVTYCLVKGVDLIEMGVFEL